MTGIIILSLILLIVVVGAIFINTSPEFGGTISEAQKVAFARTGHYEKGKFINEIPSEIEIGFKDIPALLYKQFKGDPSRQPKVKLPVLPLDSLEITQTPDTLTRITWFGRLYHP